MISIGNILFRVGMGITGCGIGALTVIPNAMLGDSGTKKAISASMFGFIASSSFALAGILGIIHCSQIPLIYAKRVALIGLVSQITAFV